MPFASNAVPSLCLRALLQFTFESLRQNMVSPESQLENKLCKSIFFVIRLDASTWANMLDPRSAGPVLPKKTPPVRPKVKAAAKANAKAQAEPKAKATPKAEASVKKRPKK